MTIPVLAHSPFEEIAYRYHEKYPLESGSAATIFTFKALGIMPSWQLSGPRMRSSLAFPLNEASQSKFLLSTLSATWPPRLERQDLPLSRH